MDRRQIITGFALACVALMFAACASAPEPRAGAPPDDGSHTDPATESSPVGPKPDASLLTLPRPERAPQTGVEARLRELSDPAHLSSDTGWLVLPEPRIADDVPRRRTASVALSDLPLLLPRVPPVGPGEHDANTPSPSAAGVAPSRDGDGREAAGPGEPPVPAQVEPEPVVEAERVRPARAAPARTGGPPETPAAGSGAASYSGASSLPDPASAPATWASPAAPSPSAAAVASGPDTGPDGPLAVAEAVEMVTRVPDARVRSAADSNATGSSATDWVTRSAAVSSRSDVVIRLPGSGWIYVGREYGDGTVTLLAKRTAGGDDEFVLRFSDDGSYGLWFQQQNARTGQLTNERLQVEAVPDGLAAVSVAELSPPEPRTAETAGETARATRETPAADVAAAGADYGAARALLDSGDATAALRAFSETLSAYPESGDELLWTEMAGAAHLAGNTPVAMEYWNKVASAGGALAGDARQRLFQVAAGGTDASALADAMDTLRTAGEVTVANVLTAAEAAERMGYTPGAIGYYQEVLRHGGARGTDEILFRLASLLEAPGDQRDLRRSLTLYERIVDEYPLSRYWNESSRRIEYIRRHFFDIR